MEQDFVKRSSVVVLLIFALMGEVLALIMLFSYAWSGEASYTVLEDAIARPVWSAFFSLLNPAFILFLIALLSKPFCSSSLFKKTTWVYFIVVAILIGASLTSGKNGILYSAIKGTETECKLVPGYHQHYCYSDLAKTTNDIKYCKKTESNDLCYVYFAEKSGDVSLCPPEDGNCIMRVAEKTKDASLCEKIADTRSHTECLGNFSYTAKSIKFEFLPLSKTLVNRGALGIELAKIKISVEGGDAKLSSLSFIDDMPNIKGVPKLTDYSLYEGSTRVRTDRSESFIRSLSDGSGSYFFSFYAYGVEPGLDISKDNPLILTIKGDIGSQAGAIHLKLSGFNSNYESKFGAITDNSDAGENVSEQIIIR